MFSLFDMPHYAAADHLEERGYPALAELFREHELRPTRGQLGWDHHPRGFRPYDSGKKPTPTQVPGMDYIRSLNCPGAGCHMYLGNTGEQYLTTSKAIPKDLHDRIISELTESKTELARELPEVPDTEFSPVKGLGGGLKSRFTSGEHTYGVRFDETPYGTHHFSFEQLTAKPDQNEHGITGAGNAVHTMTQVAAHFIHGLRKLQPTKVTFTAAEPSRQKLYDKMVAQLPKYAPDYELDESRPDDQDGSVRYFVKRKNVELQRGWDGGDLGREDQEISGPEGWIDEDGNFHENQPGPYGMRHGDTLTRLGYKNVGEGIRAGLMHLASPDGTQLLGHRSDRGYTAPQLRKLKVLAAQHSLEPAITTTQNGMVSTRSLKLARPGAHGFISPEGDHHPLGMHGLQSHDNLARQLGHKDALDAQAKGYMHVSSDFDHNLIGHNEGRKYTLPQLKVLKGIASDHGYLGAGVTEGNKTRMLKLQRDTKVTLAAETTGKTRAPEGGMVSNNQFYPGGKFLPRALKSIREVRNRKLAGKITLSREEDLHNLFHEWRPEHTHMVTKNAHGVPVTWDIPSNDHNLIAADVLQENSDLPSSPLHEFLRDARPGLPMVGNVSVMLHPARQPSARDPELRRDINNYRRPRLARRLKSLEDPSIGVHRVYFHHDPETGNGHIIGLMQTHGQRAYSWHAPATREKLQALGAKSKRMKLNKLMSPE